MAVDRFPEELLRRWRWVGGHADVLGLFADGRFHRATAVALVAPFTDQGVDQALVVKEILDEAGCVYVRLSLIVDKRRGSAAGARAGRIGRGSGGPAAVRLSRSGTRSAVVATVWPRVGTRLGGAANPSARRRAPALPQPERQDARPYPLVDPDGSGGEDVSWRSQPFGRWVPLSEVTVETSVADSVSLVREGSSSDVVLAELRPLVVRTVRLIVGAGSALAEDAAQEALLELSRSLPRLRERKAAPAYAARVAARVAMRTVKRERRFAALGLRWRESGGAVSSGQPVELLELKEAFDRLPPRQRATAVLRLYVGLSERETAEALGCSPGTVKHQLHDARRALAAYLNDDAASAEDEAL
jgi:RNA polymerase sigma factor (sigma-70 family)